MDKDSFQLELYKILRDELMFYAREIYRTEIYAAIAVASVYTWILLQEDKIPLRAFPLRAVWAIPPCIAFASAIRCGFFVIRIVNIGKYLKSIEEVAFGKDAKLCGWEHFKLRHRWIDIADQTSATLGWIVAFGVLAYVSWWLSLPTSSLTAPLRNVP